MADSESTTPEPVSPDPQSTGEPPPSAPATEPAAGASNLLTEEELAAAISAAQADAAAAPAETPAAARVEPVAAQPEPLPAAAQHFQPPDFSAAPGTGDGLATLELLDDVELDVRVELGRTDMYIEDVLHLGVGSVVELNKLAGDPVDVYVNSRLVARGEVLVLNDSFCVRINDIVSSIPEHAGAAT